MKSKKKYLKISIVVLILILISFLVFIVITLLHNEELKNNANIEEQKNYSFSDVTDATTFYIVEQCILDNMENENFLVVTEMIEKNIVEERINGYVAKAAYLNNNTIEYDNYIIYLDFENLTYEIEKIDSSITNLKEVNLQTDITEIREEDNTFEYETVTTKQKLQNYLNTICLLSLTSPELGYLYLDESYVDYGIENVEDFGEFVECNEDLFRDVVIDTYTEEKDYENEGEDRYVCVTTEGNTFVILETSIMQITFMAGRGV